MALKKRTNRNAAASKSATALGRRGKAILTSLLLAAVCVGVARLCLTASAQTETTQGRGSRSAGVTPKRPARGPQSAGAAQKRSVGAEQKGPTRAAAGADALKTGGPVANALEALSPLLAAADFDLVGLAVTASPEALTVPKNTPTSVLTSVKVPEGSDPSQIIAGLSASYRVRGELTGPSFSSPRTIEAKVGQPFPIPALAQAGDHLLQNLRVVDISQQGEHVVAPVTPDAVGIVVIERLLVSEVHVNELTYEQIVQAGINITDDNYQAFNFTIGIGTTSNAQSINIPVAFPPLGVTDPRPVVGTPTVSAPGIDVPTIVPVMLTPDVGAPDGGGGAELPQEGEGVVRIPGVVIFPGRVGFLHQFFEAIVIVANGAPDGSPLVLRNLHARAKLPDAGTPGVETDDPLRIAETQLAGRVSEMDLHGLGPDGKWGTGDDTMSFTPGQSGQGTFLLEGLKEGLHTVNFDLTATLDGLPSGPVAVKGEVPGAVLVRDASFAVTFTHPSVVRAGQEYDLAMTVTNTGSRDINGAFARLPPGSISGAEFLGQDTGVRQFATTIKRKDSATVKWRLRSNTTGDVTASYVKVGTDVSAGLQLVTGVGDRNIPLSPDSLILPDPVKHLPPDFVEAARQVLGQAWSVANAPAGSLPADVLPITKQSVVDRAVELGLAGMRVDFKEPVGVSIDTLMRDWLGELKTDDGFADALRATPSGNVYYDAIGTEIYKRMTAAGGPSAADIHRELADTESSRSSFVSAFVTGAGGQQVAGVRLSNAAGQKVGFGATAADARAVDSRAGGAMFVGRTDANTHATTNIGQMVLMSKTGSENHVLELFGWQAGAADISLLYPASGRTYRHVTWSGVQMTEGGKYRVTFRASSSTTAVPVLEVFEGGVYVPSPSTATFTTIEQPAPRLVGAVQVTPDVVAGGDKYGRLVGLLFSKPMLKEQAENVSKYAIGGGQLKNTEDVVGGPVAVKGAHIDYGDRFVFLALDSPIGPYIRRDVTVSAMSDARRLALAPSPSTALIDPRVSPQGKPPGAYLTGRVLNADGTPVPNAPVVYWTQECPDPARSIGLPPPPMPVAVKYTDAQGRYVIDYVRDGDCAPLNVTVTNPQTKSEKRLTSPVAYDGQHMVFDMVFLARGNVRGTIKSGGRGVPGAFVSIVPALDVVGRQVVQTDESGNYSATDVPVGNVSIFSVGTGDYSLASGFAAGNIDGPNQTAVINVSMQNVGGGVAGRVLRADGTPSAGALVVAYALIPGVSSPSRGDGMTAVGYVYADRDGRFDIRKIPVSDVALEVTDYVTGMKASQRVTLTTQSPVITGVLLTLPGFGSVSGRVVDETGSPVPKAYVSASGRAVLADESGNFLLQNLPAGVRQISATNAEAVGQTGSTSVQVQIGQTTENVTVVILRPASVQGRVFVVEQGTTTPKPLSGVYVTSNGIDLAQTDAQGNYKLSHVSPNMPLTLRYIDVGKAYGYNLDVRLSPGETLTRDVTFRPGTIRGRVTQPDGVTGVVADINLFVLKPSLKPGPDLGLLTSGSPSVTRTGADGSYSVSGNNPGAFRVSTSNVFFPTPVSAGGVLAPSGAAECNLSLVSTLAGKIQGRVYQPDGTTPVGANVRVTLGGGSLADAAVRTDETGRYEFGEVFSAGSYTLTATDLTTGYTNRIGVSVQKNQDAVFDLRLLGNGSLRVKVVDGGGQPVDSGSVSLNGSAFPYQRRFAEITGANDGVIVFDNLPEGPYAISATRLGLGGRAAVNVTPGSTVETTIQLLASGSVEGHVYMPNGTTPVALADVELTVAGRTIGFSVTSDDAADAGKFQFLNVPAGDFTLDVFDNRTGRVGRSYGTVTAQGQVVTINVHLLAVGAVAGRVTANGLPVDHALVEISSDGSGLVRTSLKATTDPDGRYRFAGIPAGRFTVHVKDAPGGQTGSVSGTISGTTEPLPDTVADIALEPSQTVTGTVYKLGGTEPVPGALVTLDVNNRTYKTAANESGVYRVGFIPLGQVRVRATAPAGNDRGEAAPVTGSTPGGTVTSDVTFAGTGDVSGLALDSNGAPLSLGEVVFTNSAWGSQVRVTTTVRADGRYEFKGVPAGAFTLKLTVTGRVGSGNASGTALAGENVDLPLRLEDAGKVRGRLLNESGDSPAAGVDVTLTLFRASSGTLVFYTHSDSQGVWSFDNLPLGGVNVLMSDTATGGLAQVNGLSLATNGQVLDVGDVRIDSTPISVTSIAPADGTPNVSPVNAKVTINFSEAASASTVSTSTVRLLHGASSVSSKVVLSSDGREATLTPNSRLADTTAYTVSVTTGVKDLSGLRLTSEFRSIFTTSDATAPTVASVSPANDAAHVALGASVTVNFNEPLDPAQQPGDVVKVAASDGQLVAGAYTRGADLRSITLAPSLPLAEAAHYFVSVTGQRDASGNAQANGFTSDFTTLDQTPPVIDPLPIDGQRVRTFRPAITATYRDNLSGVKTSTVVLTVDGVNVTANASVTGTGLSYTPQTPLTRGDHTVTLRASDNDGNQSATRTATFNIDDSGPIITGFTIAGQPATNGMFVTSTLQPVVNVTYNDDTGADAAASKLLIGFGSSTPQPVEAAVTGTGITYQSPTPMAEGTYTIEAVVVNGLGTSTSTGRISFTLDVDAPEILSVTPSSGSQHGGTTLTVTGNRLMSGVASQGLTGHYYDNMDFTGAEIVRVDPVVNFNWDTGSPDASMGADQFSVRWTGQVQAQTTEDYTFYTFSDDGVRLYVNNQLIINNWTDHAPTENSGVFHMVAGQKYDIRAECYESAGGALMSLSWSSASVAKQIVPQTALTSTGLAPQVTVGGANAKVIGITAGSPDVMTLDTPAGAPGPADVEVTTDRGRGLAAGAFTYTADPRTPFALGPDTLVLWHLDESGNGAVSIEDAAGLVTASADADSTVQPGRFGHGRARANIASGQDVENVLTLGNKSFTLECWMKTGALGRTYTLVGKDHATNGSSSYVYGNFSLQAMPGGSLRAFYYDGGNSKRQVDMPATTMRVDDDQWHHVAMVVDRDSARLIIYVDGTERAAASIAGATGVTTYNDYPLRAGHYDSNGPSINNTSAPLEFPGTLDEVRLSSTAHSAEAIRQTYLGTEGTLGLVLLEATPYTMPRGTTVTIDVSGYNLANVSATVTDAAGVPQQTRTVYSSANAARVEVAVSPSAALGGGQLVLSSAAGTVTSQLLFVEVGQSAYGVESDTRLLWHLDETSGTRVSDASTYSIDGAAAPNSSVAEGRFGLGRKRASLMSDDDNDMLEFGNTSFTAECWVKTGRVERTYTLVGKDHPSNGSSSYVYGNFSLQIMPAGGLRAFYYDGGNSKRQTQMPATVYDVDDDRWHHVAMVVDREAARLSIYVDGVERSFISIAGATGITTYNDYPLRAGHYDSNGPSINNTSAPLEFPGTLDEIRVSSTAHSAARLKADFDGSAALSVNSVQPSEVRRNKNSAQRLMTTVNVDGYDLSGVAARVERQGEVLDVTVSVAESSYRSARLELGVGPNVVLGPSKLVISKPGRADVSADLYISEKSELTLDNDTLVLWRMNETQDGAATIADSSPLSIDGHADANSKAREGRFLGGRSLANIQSDDDFGALDFGNKSFTTECWVKTPPVERTYTLVGKDHPSNGSSSYVYGNFSLQLMPSGGLRAFYYDGGNSKRQADMAPTAYDVDDDQWHHVAMVVNREAGRLSIYVDGLERGFLAIAGATGVTTYNDYPLRAGHYDSNGPSVTNTSAPTQFPGTLDEIRVSATAHSPERILADALGYDAIRLLRVLPSSLQRGASNVPVTITGNGLSNVTLTTDRPEVGVQLVSTNATQIKALVSVPASSALGTLTFTATNLLGQTASITEEVVDQKAFANGSDDNNNTLVLWHLDETANGAAPFVGGGDPVPAVIGGTPSANAASVPARFNNGKTLAGITGSPQSSTLLLGNSSFTAECWVKTGPVERTYTLVGKDHQTNGSSSHVYGIFSLQIMPGGSLRAFFYDGGNSKRMTEMTPRTFDTSTGQWLAVLDDDQWHYVAMVVDRALGRLSIYVDGVERSFTAISGTGGTTTYNEYPFRAGHYDSNGPSLPNTSAALDFPGTLDEIRVSKFARTAAEIRQTWTGSSSTQGGGSLGASQMMRAAPAAAADDAAARPDATPSMRVTSATPDSVERDKAAPRAQVTELTLTGEGLKGVGARLAREDKPLDAKVEVLESSEESARLRVSIGASVPLGAAQLVLSKQGQPDAIAMLQVTEPGEFAVEADTTLLLHMDETEQGAARFKDSGAAGLEVAADATSAPAEGRFGAGRALARATAQLPQPDSLPASKEGFTVESWFKSEPVKRDYILVGKGANRRSEADWTLSLLPSGALRAVVYDVSGIEWRADTSESGLRFDDGRWHSAAAVLDRTTNSLFVYVDGRLYGMASMPLEFGVVRASGQSVQLGVYDFDGATAEGPEAFPGTLDEVRISSTPHALGKIAADFFGHDAPEVTSVSPATLAGGTRPAELTLHGYGLAGAKVAAVGSDLKVAVKSSTRTRIELHVSVPVGTPAGRARFEVTDPVGQTTSFELEVKESAGAKAAPKDSAPARAAAPAPTPAGRRASRVAPPPPAESEGRLYGARGAGGLRR